MVLTVDINASKLYAALNRLPGEVSRQMRASMHAALNDVQAESLTTHRFINRSGKAQQSVQTQVSDSGLRGKIGIVNSIAPYGKFLHSGTRRHLIKPKTRKSLHFVVGGGEVFAKLVNHPGTRPDPWLFKAFTKQRTRFVDTIRRGYVASLKLAGLSA